jgi:LPPG:FO 2-phospho-L-lactate transferase
VVVLAGGTGGAKLARGMLDVVGGERLTVIANTGDDVEIYGAHVSPDPDLISFWLADQIDARGWGLEGDSFNVMAGLRELGEEIWFNLGDRDLAIGVQRAAALARGERLTAAQATISTRLGIEARVLPMSDEPVRTRVLADGRWRSLQEFLIRGRGQGEIEDIQFRGADAAAPTADVLAALAGAAAIVIGPSNPILSIGPILAVPGLHEAILKSPAPVVAVSPLVGGSALKGPTAACMRWAGVAVSTTGLAELYGELLDGLISDEPMESAHTASGTDMPQALHTDVLMDTPEARGRVAAAAIDFAGKLALPAPSSSVPHT